MENTHDIQGDRSRQDQHSGSSTIDKTVGERSHVRQISTSLGGGEKSIFGARDLKIRSNAKCNECSSQMPIPYS